MIDIHKRIEALMQKEILSASQFADKIGVQRSSISHILSGRNKPSLDFIQKVLSNFPRLESQWLIMGEGQMYKNANPIRKEAINSDTVNKPKQEHNTSDIPLKTVDKLSFPTNKAIEKIIILYKDNTFAHYTPE